MPTDPVSAFTHLAGAIVFAVLGVALVRRAGESWRRWPLGVFAAAAVVLLMASFAFHALPAGSAARTAAQRVDHAAIFTLIAGTMTPIQVILFRGVLRWGLLAFVWAAAVAGLTLKAIYFNAVPEAVGVAAYLALGWVGTISIAVIFWRSSARFVSPLVIGGLAYSVGAVCEFTSEPTLVEGVIGSHEVFHFAVLVGLGCQWAFIRRLARCDAPLSVRRDLERGERAAAEVEAKPGLAESVAASSMAAGRASERERR